MSNSNFKVRPVMDDQETEVFDQSEQEDEEIDLQIGYSISSYGADYPIDSLVVRMKRGDVFIPSFQRGFIWTWTQASRFIESLLLGLPVPGIFLFKEPASKRLMVVDGQQRLRSLTMFYEGSIRNRVFKLKGVSKEFSGVTYESLDSDLRRILDDSILHATIFYQDYPSGDHSSIYQVFERLNTGGTPLSPQEIRTCLYRGRFEKMLRDLNKDQAWRNIYGPENRRGKDKELILRMFAFKHRLDQYSRPLKQFLNWYMDTNSNACEEWIENQKKSFCKATSVADRSALRSILRRGKVLSAPRTEAVLVGLWRRTESGPIEQLDGIRNATQDLYNNDDFIQATVNQTTSPSSVRTRIEKAIQAFSTIK